jgi:hypothetical protein
VERFGLAQLNAQLVSTDLGQQRRTVFVALPTAHEHQALIEIDIPHPELAALRHAQASAVDQRGHQLRNRIAQSAWFCVLAETRWRTARCVG